MEEKTKDDSEIITRAIKEMEGEGTLYKADGKLNIPLIMEKSVSAQWTWKPLLQCVECSFTL